MSRARIGLPVIVANLMGLIALVFIYPSAMVSPGALTPEHAELQDQCLSCHAPFRGAASERCIGCHTVADIGAEDTRSTESEHLTKQAMRVSFHQELDEQNCVACHSEHGRLTKRRFSHSLLRPAARGDCASCHTAPTNALHRALSVRCNQCHTTERWESATFDHDRFFRLEGAHDTRCTTCHTNGDFTRYTCFGCHAHSPENIRAEHEEEGIRDLDDCVSCHRSAEGERGERGEEREDDEEE